MIPPAGRPRGPGRAWVLAAAVLLSALQPAAGQLPDWSVSARQRLLGGASSATDEAMAQRRRWLDDGERLLSQGQAAAAQETFERAAMMLHAPDTEAALVRAKMQSGDYRGALAFGAHAAGAHRRDWPAGTALYGWLLQVGGQGVVARRTLDEALALAPDDTALLAAQTQLASPWPRAGDTLRQPPLQIAPYAVGAAVPADSRVVGSAVLLRSGSEALVPMALLGATADPVWLRNGLGQTVSARLESVDEAMGLALLRLDTPLPAAALQPVGREPFAGSPGAMVEFAIGDGSAAWPLLRQGFFARVTGSGGGPRALGIDAPAGPRGGPVFDAWGRLAGIAIATGPGQDHLVPASALIARFGAPRMGDPAPAGGVAALGRVEVDEIYEQALPTTLQLLRQP